VFQRSACAVCHTVRGTEAGGALGPDLTHVASRAMLGAGVLPNTHGNLAGWVANPQGIKPGVIMPAVPLRPQDLHAVVAYLQDLK
jgi:cytochrome c oxidase subunit 2